MDPTFCIFS